MNFSQGHSGTKVQFVNRACFPKERHQNSQNWTKFMNFSFWPFVWFGLPGRLLNYVGDLSDLSGDHSLFSVHTFFPQVLFGVYSLVGNASLFTKFLFTIFGPLDPPPPLPTSKMMDFLLNFY